MLSSKVVWTDIDADEWANLWHFGYAPERRPRRAIAVLREGEPLALVVGGVGSVSLDVWPKGAVSLDAAADQLRTNLGVDQAILVEQSVLVALWDEQQRFLDHEDDYDDYVLGIRNLTELKLRDHAVCSPRELDDGFREIPYEAIKSLVADAVGSEGAFLVTVFDGDRLWWSVAASLNESKIVRLTSSQGLLAPGVALPDLSWADAHAHLVRLCEEEFGPVKLALGLQLSAFDSLLQTNDLAGRLAQATSNGEATLLRSHR